MLDQPTTDLRTRLIARIDATPTEVWTPGDFADLGSRAAVNKTPQRLAAAGELRRIDRGLYDRPRKSNLTGKPMVPRLSRRHQGYGAPRPGPRRGRRETTRE